MTVSTTLIEEELTRVVRDFPLLEHPSESKHLRREVPRCLAVGGLIAAQCPKDGRLLSVECESGLLEILLKRECGFDSIAGISSSPAPGLTRRLAAFDIPLLECRIDRDPIPERDGAFTGILLSRVGEHLRSGLPHVLAECRRVLTSGGTLVLGTRHVAEFGSEVCLRNRNRMAWSQERTTLLMGNPRDGEPTGEPTERELTRLLGEAGFLIDKVRFLSADRRILARLGSVLRPHAGWAMYFIARRP